MLFGAVSNARARVYSFLIFASDLSRVHEIPRDNWPLIYFLAVAVSPFSPFFVVGPQNLIVDTQNLLLAYEVDVSVNLFAGAR